MSKLQQRKIYVDILNQATTEDNVRKKCDTLHFLIELDNQILGESEGHFICENCDQAHKIDDQVLIPNDFPIAICDDCYADFYL